MDVFVCMCACCVDVCMQPISGIVNKIELNTGLGTYVTTFSISTHINVNKHINRCTNRFFELTWY